MILLEKREIIKEILQESENAYKEGILPEEKFREIRETVEKNTLKFGICGQVKTGKSTFINSYVFGKNVLPVASTPMTASLCYIKYGESPQVEVEFFTQIEWNEIEKLVEEDENAHNVFDSEKIKAAKEYVKYSQKIRNEMPNLLGQKIQISFDELKHYVGSEGRYTPIVKSLTIALPYEILKNVVIVDTPGTNDPVTSRERRTLDFLKEADVVFLFCYSGRPFDKSDRELLRRLKNSVGKIIIIINKKDIILAEEGTEEKVKIRFNEQINELIKEIQKEDGNPFIINILKDAKNKIVFFSSLWALLGRLEEREIFADEDLSYYYEKFKEEFPNLKDHSSFFEHSGIKELDSTIKEVLKEKDNLLIIKPVNIIISSFKEKVNKLKEERDQYEREIKNYQYSLEEIEKELKKLERTKDEISEVYTGLNIELEKKIKEGIIEQSEEFRKVLKEFYNKIEFKIPKKTWHQRHSTYRATCENIFDKEFYQLKDDLEGKLFEIRDKYFKELDNFIKNFFNQLKDKSEQLLITRKDYKVLLDKIENNLKIEINEVKSFSRYGFTTYGFLFWGTSGAKESIMAQISQILFDNNGLMDKIKDNLQRFESKIKGILSNLMQYIENNLFIALEDPLKRSREEYKNKKQRIEELKKLIEDKNSEISEKEKKYESIKNKFSSIVDIKNYL